MKDQSGKIRKIFSSAIRKVFHKGDPIIIPETNKYVYLLLKGSVKQYSLTNEGEEIIYHQYRPPAVFPIALILARKDVRHFFEAISESEICILPAEKFLTTLEDDKELLLYFLQNISAGLIGLTVRLDTMANTESFNKIVSLLLYFAQKGRVKGNRVEIEEYLTHRELAGWVGSTRETVSRQLEKLKKENLISYKGKKLVIKNLAKLKEKI